MGESARTGRRRDDTPAVAPATPSDLLAAPGYGARRLYQAYLAAWNRHVDPVLTGPQFAVLSAVRAYPGSDQSSLAGAVALDTSTMADLCRRLERRGLIQRVESPHDARRKLLSLTDEGKSVLSQVNRRARRLDKALLDGDDDVDMAALLNALGARWERIAEVDKLR
ncbi:MarR family winged helix-turn-helix transcriptional regulator [Amycolatopsis roodepoortensis]|uniref:MarR family winged helix-turn-helix transcriptional regulator n=1 Tax=Amycolatopsis roodepoortensis TaxID=700274 RepID=UPI000F892A91|nr:MarR family winged helix-turn-helix transcriptional regulator [Amycolatopsis roodepoortensis]RSN16760.1 MarR family transcriptional regulator [Streptomyces sp. WAC 05977]UUV31448.1 MarR family winged helix-turn-helix transcriptional regulator [Amycolatopsis roodepoortensis]